MFYTFKRNCYFNSPNFQDLQVPSSGTTVIFIRNK